MKLSAIFEVLLTFFGLGIAFFLGHFSGLDSRDSVVRSTKKPIFSETSVVSLSAIKGDQIQVEIFGPARVAWNEKNFVEGDGVHEIPIGQIPNENDLEFENFPYVGNAKTKKFYPANSYPARGTEYRYRRFFESKSAAEKAGFIATKLVK